MRILEKCDFVAYFALEKCEKRPIFAVGADRCVCPKISKLVQASESQVYLSFYSECSQGSSPRSGVKVESCSCNFDDTGSNRSQVALPPLRQ